MLTLETMDTKVYHIDLEDYRTPKSKVFTTRPRGVEVRNATKIDHLIDNYDQIIINIPSDIASINPSFLEEFLENIVIKLGKSLFFERVKFVGNGRYNIEIDLDEAIDRILRDESALS